MILVVDDFVDSKGSCEAVQAFVKQHNAKVSGPLTACFYLHMCQKISLLEFGQQEGNIRVKLVAMKESMGTASVLRHIQKLLVSDFIVMTCDLITNFCLRNLTDVHCIVDASCTMLLKRAPPVDPRKKKSKSNAVTQFVGFEKLTCRRNAFRILYMASELELGDKLVMPMQLLARRPNLMLDTDLTDVHFYVFSHWVLKILEKQPDIDSIRADLVPYLIRKQLHGLNKFDPDILAKVVRHVNRAHGFVG